MINTRNTALSRVTGFFRDILNYFSSDARHYQVLFLFTFLLFGIFKLGWEVELMRFNVTLLTCLGVQAIGIHFTTKDYSGLKSALISAFSLCLMLHTNSLWTMALAAVLSISSKFFIRWKGKHIFNPTNFGIISTILIMRLFIPGGDAWVSPGQWGSDALLFFLVGIAGLVVLFRVKRLDTAIAFLVAFLGLSYARDIIYQGWPHDFFLHKLTSGSLLLFSFFMITDPVQTPSSMRARIIWALMVGALAWYMTAMLQIQHAAPLWALFFLSPLVPVFDRLLPGPRFQWRKDKQPEKVNS
ncbi:MAG: Na+-transporting NADH:ubiquinone oxidoreductase, subunit NqrB [Bacteroidetes bacterium]|nr:MAG: Na+-transporting NADH:ubiquinone oxidoreductase, subunit NqrB [Bacteroidota bacterium]